MSRSVFFAPTRIGALALALLIAVAMVFAPLFTPVARAANNPNIVVTVTSFLSSDAYGNTSNARLTVGNVGKLSFTWDATATTAVSSDSFSMDFGE